MYSVYFTATVYDDCNVKDRTECGVITCVKGFADAMTRIESFYGNTLEKIEIELFDTNMMIFKPEDGEHIHEILEGNAF